MVMGSFILLLLGYLFLVGFSQPLGEGSAMDAGGLTDIFTIHSFL
jgi:hypothetical protein